METFTFKKEERLCSQKTIDAIFKQGKKVKQFPFIATYLEVKESDSKWDFPVKIVVSVPKKRVKRAVKRNRLKRQIKEAYRLNKAGFYQNLTDNNQQMALFLVYIGQENENFNFIEKKLKELLIKIQDSI